MRQYDALSPVELFTNAYGLFTHTVSMPLSYAKLDMGGKKNGLPPPPGTETGSNVILPTQARFAIPGAAGGVPLPKLIPTPCIMLQPPPEKTVLVVKG